MLILVLRLYRSSNLVLDLKIWKNESNLPVCHCHNVRLYNLNMSISGVICMWNLPVLYIMPSLRITATSFNGPTDEKIFRGQKSYEVTQIIARYATGLAGSSTAGCYGCFKALIIFWVLGAGLRPLFEKSNTLVSKL